MTKIIVDTTAQDLQDQLPAEETVAETTETPTEPVLTPVVAPETAEPTVDSEPPAEIDLNNLDKMTKSDLLNFATLNEIDLDKNLTKDKMLAAIRAKFSLGDNEIPSEPTNSDEYYTIKYQDGMLVIDVQLFTDEQLKDMTDEQVTAIYKSYSRGLNEYQHMRPKVLGLSKRKERQKAIHLLYSEMRRLRTFKYQQHKTNYVGDRKKISADTVNKKIILEHIVTGKGVQYIIEAMGISAQAIKDLLESDTELLNKIKIYRPRVQHEVDFYVRKEYNK